MMRRRTFLKIAGAGATLLGSGNLLTACGSEGGGMANQAEKPLGVQLYTLRDLLPSGVGKVLSDIAAIGYREVELFGLGYTAITDKPLFGLSAPEFRAALDDAGLTAPIAHISGDAVSIPELADLAHEVGVHHLVVATAPDFLSFENGEVRFTGVTDHDQLDRIAERLNQQGEMARASGIGFGYHNHQLEFAPLGDGNAFDYLFSQADADLVKIELDLGWTIVAGIDPIDILRRYGNRVIAVHVKDFDPSRPAGDAADYRIPELTQIVEPGSGPTNFAPILGVLDEIGVHHRFVEIDVSSDPVSAVKRGYDYLESL